jgi:hypothetical protein
LAVVAGDAVKAAGLQNCAGLPVAEKLKIKQLGNLGYRICPWSLCNSTKKARKQLSEKTEETPAGPPWNPVFDLQQVQSVTLLNGRTGVGVGGSVGSKSSATVSKG